MLIAKLARGGTGAALLVALGLGLATAFGALTDHGPSLVDEYVYLAGGKHFARTGTLWTRFYETDAILRQGHPYKDVHAPGYVLVLGALMAVVRGGYWTAVGLNVACYLGSALLVRDMSGRLFGSAASAWMAGAAFLVLPTYPLFNFWVMAEPLLGFAFLSVLAAGIRYGHTARGAALTGLLYGAAFLVRESVLFGLPAVLVSVARRRTLPAFLGAAVAFGALVVVPLSKGRQEGGGATSGRRRRGSPSAIKRCRQVPGATSRPRPATCGDARRPTRRSSRRRHRPRRREYWPSIWPFPPAPSCARVANKARHAGWRSASASDGSRWSPSSSPSTSSCNGAAIAT